MNTIRISTTAAILMAISQSTLAGEIAPLGATLGATLGQPLGVSLPAGIGGLTAIGAVALISGVQMIKRNRKDK